MIKPRIHSLYRQFSTQAIAGEQFETNASKSEQSLPEVNSLQNWEYLQLNVNYYPREDTPMGFSNNQDSDVWKGLQSYLDLLHKQGWIMINETPLDKGQFRTYHLKRPVE